MTNTPNYESHTDIDLAAFYAASHDDQYALTFELIAYCSAELTYTRDDSNLDRRYYHSDSTYDEINNALFALQLCSLLHDYCYEQIDFDPNDFAALIDYLNLDFLDDAESIPNDIPALIEYLRRINLS